jgi:hypothetical protein
VPTRREKGRNGRWAAEAQEHRLAWGESGLTRLGYARKAGLAPSTLSRWLRNLKKLEEGSGADARAGGRATTRPAKAGEVVVGDSGRPSAARLVAVQVAAPAVEENGGFGEKTSKAACPVELALPSGIRIRYPGGVGYEELSMLVGLLEREC